MFLFIESTHYNVWGKIKNDNSSNMLVGYINII